MTHWYGWLGLLLTVFEALGSLLVIAANASRRARGSLARDNNVEHGIVWLAAWTTLAVAMVVA